MRWLMMVLIVAGCGDDPAPPAPADLAVPADDLSFEGPPSCPGCDVPPGPNQVCVKGSLYDAASGRPLSSGGTSVRIAAYEPLSLQANPNTPPLAEEASTNRACYWLTVPAPASGRIAVGVQSPVGSSGTLAPTVRSIPVEKGKVYKLDVYALQSATAASWQAAIAPDGGAGFGGGTLVEYFADPAPPAFSWLFNEASPGAGVTVTLDGTPTGAVYLDANGAPGTGASTGARGAAILGGSGWLSGAGGCNGACTWEMVAAQAVPGMWTTLRLHNCALSTGAPFCP